jgi:outer membrane protein OmpU
MKKVLFATAALIATGSVAAADVTFGGYGRFGVLYQEDDGTGDSSTDITSRFRLQIDVSAESDGGVVFGARTRLEGEERDAAGLARPQFSGVRYFARYNGLEVGVGNIFGSLPGVAGMYPIDLGLTGLSYAYAAVGVGGHDDFASGGLGSSGSNGVEVDYTTGGFNFHASASDTNDRVAARVNYSFGNFKVGAGYQDSDSNLDTEFVLGATGTFGAAFVSVSYGENGAGDSRAVLTGTFDIGAASQIVGYISDDDVNGSSFGIGFEHDLGGGTSLQGGYDDNYGDALVDFGVRFNF